jgi:hypothetical protein
VPQVIFGGPSKKLAANFPFLFAGSNRVKFLMSAY